MSFPESIHPVPTLVLDSQSYGVTPTGTVFVTFSLDTYFGIQNDTAYQMSFVVETDSQTLTFYGSDNLGGRTLAMPSVSGSVSFQLSTTSSFHPGYYGYKCIDISASDPIRLIGNPSALDGPGMGGPNAVHTPVYSGEYPLQIHSGVVGAAYIYNFFIAGSSGDTFTVSAGKLPPGLSLDITGILEGTPTSEGTYGFTVTSGTINQTFILEIYHPVVEVSPSTFLESSLFCASRSEIGGLPANPRYHFHAFRTRWCVLAKSLYPGNYPCVFSTTDDGITWVPMDQSSAPGYHADTDLNHTTEFVWDYDGLETLYFIVSTYDNTTGPTSKNLNIYTFSLRSGTWTGTFGDSYSVTIDAKMKQMVYTDTNHLRLFYVIKDSVTPTIDDLMQVESTLASSSNWQTPWLVDSAPTGLIAKLFYCAYVRGITGDYSHLRYNVHATVSSIAGIYQRYNKTNSSSSAGSGVMPQPPAFDPTVDTMDTVYFSSGAVVYDKQNNTLDWPFVGANASPMGQPGNLALRKDDAKSLYIYHESLSGGWTLELVEGNTALDTDKFLANNDGDSNAWTWPASCFLVRDWYGSEIMFWVGAHDRDSGTYSDSIFMTKKYFRTENGVAAWSPREEVVTGLYYHIGYAVGSIFATPGTS